MKEQDLITSLEKLRGDRGFGEFASSVVTQIRTANRIAIVDRGENATTDRQNLLETYSLRQRRLVKKNKMILGLEPTILALRLHTCDRIKLVSVDIEGKYIALLFTPGGELIGGYLPEHVRS